MEYFAELGNRLKEARKKRFPADDLKAFSLRIGVSRATLQKMEKGDMSVSLGRYYLAAKRLELTAGFDELFKQPESLFDD